MMESPIEKFYNSSRAFLTGGTGFMGRVLIEKMLRTTDISTLYLLVRNKGDQNVHQVLDKLFEDKIFENLKKVCPSFRKRVRPVLGDCSKSDLGLSYPDRQELIANTNIIFHLAATIRFDTNLKEAFAINVNGTKDIVIMAKQMKHLKAFVHVSTAYSNYPREIIDEKIYDFPYSCEGISSVLNELNYSDVEKLTPQLLGRWPNTYTFTKALTESFIQSTGNDLPIAVFRPSIVMPTYKEPLEGWTNSLNGPIGISLGVASGILKVMPHDVGENIADLVPVDSCVAGLMATAWDVSTKFTDRYQENIAVYNFVCSRESPISWKNLMNKTVVQAKQQLSDSNRRIMVIYPANVIIFWTLMTALHLIPAFLIDIYAAIRKKKFRLSRIYKKYLNGYTLLYPFFSRTWTFRNQNMKNVWRKMDKRDQELFRLSMEAVNWDTYIRSYVKGLHNNFLEKSTIKTIVSDGKQDRNHLLSQFLKSALVFIVTSYVLFYWI